MKRNMELVREILIEMEKWPADSAGEIQIAGRAPEEITYHLGLMADRGLINAIDASSNGGSAWLPQGITWEGHEFLDAARSNTVWERAKKHVLSTTGTLTIEGLKAAFPLIIRQMVSGG